MDPNNYCLVGTANMACESASNSSASPAFQALNTNYQSLGQGGRSVFQGFGGVAATPLKISETGFYDWWAYGCRISNIAIANLDLLTGATKEEKEKLEGQALFFRAYLNFSVLCAYGSIPYLDQVYDQNNIEQPRYYTDAITGKKNYQAASEKAVRDLERAAELLPVVGTSY
jgi:hypothetical protein